MRHTARRSWKIAIAAATTLGLAIGIAGCSGSGNAQDAKAPIKIWVNQPLAKTQWQDAVKAFTKKTGIPATVTGYQNDQFKQQIANATGTSTMPDVFVQWSGIGLLGNIYDAGAIEPQDANFTKFGWDSRFNKTAEAAITLDGKKMGVPFQVQEMAVVYKKSTFEKAGITPPTTFAELEADNAKFLAQGITPWSFAGKNSWDTMRLTDSLLETTCGAKEFDKLRDLKATWKNSSCAEKAFSTFQNWVKKGWLTKNYMGLDPNANDMWKPIIAGTAAMTIDGNWSEGSLTKLGGKSDDYSYFVFPTDTNRLSYFATSVYESSNSKNKAGAAKLLDFLTKASTVEKYPTILNGAIAATNGVPVAAKASAYVKGWVDLGKKYPGVYGPSDQAFPPDVAQAFLLANDKQQLGQATPAQTVEAIQQAADTYKASKG